MVKYTRQHYIEIGKLVRKLPKKKKMTEYRKWNKIFTKDNPRYNSARFKKFIKL